VRGPAAGSVRTASLFARVHADRSRFEINPARPPSSSSWAGCPTGETAELVNGFQTIMLACETGIGTNEINRTIQN